MANAQAVNQVLYSAGESSFAVWKLTRTMLSAGWKYMASSSGLGNGNATPGITNQSPSGVTGAITAFGSNLATLTVPPNLGTMLTGGGSETNASTAVTFTQNQTLAIGSSLYFSTSGPTNYGVALSGTVSVANANANITFSTSQTLAIGSALVFTSSSQPSTYYFLNAAVAGTAGTLTTNFTGTTDTTSTVSYLAALSGTVTLSASTSVTTTSNLTTVVQPGDLIMFSAQPDVTYTVATVSSTTITLTTSYTGTTGSGFYAVDLGGTYYFLNAAVSNTTSGTLQTNYTGTTNTAGSTVKSIAALSGTFTVTNASPNVTATSSQATALNPGDIVVFSSQPGVYYQISAVVTTAITLTTNYTGTGGGGKYCVIVSSLNAGCVGQWVTLSNSSNAGNNGTFLVTSQTGTTAVLYNASGVANDYGTGSPGTISFPTVHWTFLKAPSLDLWGVGGAVNLRNVPSGGSGSGTGVSIGAASLATGASTITNVSGFTQNLSPGRYLTITGSEIVGGPSNISNNGSFRILSATAAGTSVTVYAPGMTAETTNSLLSVVEQYGGNDGSIGAFSTVTSGQSTLITFSTSSFTGFTVADVGRRITINNPASAANLGTFIIAQFLTTSSVLLYNPSGVASDGNNPNLQWVEYDTQQQLYPVPLQVNNGFGAWLILQGPTTLKIPIGTNVSTGTFIRGENITQTATGAQGELMGYMPDPAGGTGFLVVAPRVVGTGVDASSVATYGWNNVTTDTITGAFSTATVTSTAVGPTAYIREFVFWHNNVNGGHLYNQCIDQNPLTESLTTATTGRFSTMANQFAGSSSSPVTPTLCPGGATSGAPFSNGFPTIGTMVAEGTAGSGSAGTNAVLWTSGTNPASYGRAHLLCANNIEQQGISQDGSWGYYQASNSLGYIGISYQRLDNQEDGDLDPYVIQTLGGYGYGNTTAFRTQMTSSQSNTSDGYNTNNGWFNSNNFNQSWRGFRRRGLPNVGTGYGISGNPNSIFGDSFIGFQAAQLEDPGEGFLLNINTGYPDQVATAPTIQYVREPVWIYSASQAGYPRMRKGTPRWLMLTQGMQANQTTDGMKWIVLSSNVVTNGSEFVAGPWDGVSTPTF